MERVLVKHWEFPIETVSYNDAEFSDTIFQLVDPSGNESKNELVVISIYGNSRYS